MSRLFVPVILFLILFTNLASAAVTPALLRSAEQGNADSQYQVGITYLRKAQGQNYLEAVKWLRLAADSGHANAQYSLALRYLLGQGVKKDPEQAADWLQKAAQQNHADAQYSLGMRFFYGQGREKDKKQAWYWLRKAAAQGQADALKMKLPAVEKKSPAKKKDDQQDTEKLIEAYIEQVFAETDDQATVAEKKRLEELLTPKETLQAIQQAHLRLGENDISSDQEFNRQLDELSDSNTFAADYFFIGNRMIKEGNLPLAILAYERSLELAPENPSGLRNLASAYAHTGKNEKAIKALQRSIELSPQQASKHATLGLVYHVSGDLDNALRKYRDAAALNPGLGWFYPDMADILLQQGQYNLARQALLQAKILGMERERIWQRFVALAPQKYQQESDQPTASLHLRQLMFASAEEAEEALRELKNGADFYQLGMSRATVQFQKNSGYWGPYLPEQLAPKIKAVLADLAPFAYSPIIETSAGFHILQKFLFYDQLLTAGQN
ncbi:Sel1 repeat-containing protein [Malonomonas rubra DSM 5091]|uniref:Sel1 repeat-containing protein n=1 Tax=Malonomonas rubra DSM 5091 TaxID=1122189 RepID=A0A1M6E5B8_MALRU|nr:tetratricopeptide repeat protein [Malonomonas rubra]SHI80550.1 Sel1 repeat-containing protein [Malonomonas rubra DSM 5091]